jgi:peroxiredoxin
VRLWTATAMWMVLAIAGLAGAGAGAALDLEGKAADPLAGSHGVVVLIFARTDCPLANRYAPELRRVAEEFEGRGVRFWTVYPDPAETTAAIREQMASYQLPGGALRDPRRELVKRARATVAPEAAVFDAGGRLVYHGRIDDRWVDFGVARREAQTHDLEDAIRAALEGKPVAKAETRAIGCSLADVE